VWQKILRLFPILQNFVPGAVCLVDGSIRYYDFNVWSRRKLVEKLRYIHRNPVERGLVASPELWRWSSYRAYALGET
jgi:REP element-mobilizing transposase RayT